MCELRYLAANPGLLRISVSGCAARGASAPCTASAWPDELALGEGLDEVATVAERTHLDSDGAEPDRAGGAAAGTDHQPELARGAQHRPLRGPAGGIGKLDAVHARGVGRAARPRTASRPSPDAG